MTAIVDVHARQILDSRGNPTVEVEIALRSGATGRAAVPSGASTGEFEATELRDGGDAFLGKGVTRAVANVNGEIADAVAGFDVLDQSGLDRRLIDLDGTPNKSRLGANAIVGVSIACLEAAAASSGLPLYQYIGGTNARTIPIPIYGIGTGGRYRDPGTSRWLKPSYELAAYGAGSYEAAVEWSWRAVEESKRLLRKRYPDTYVPQYHGSSLAGVIGDDRELLDVMAESIDRIGGAGNMGLYFDVAADCYYERDRDRYVGLFRAGERDRDQQIKALQELVDAYPVVSLEDPLHENDFEGHALATKALGIEVVGDDIFTTNAERLREGIELGACSSMVLKITQVGTVSEALAACRLAHQHGYNVHPCGSRGDRGSIGDFAVGLNAGQVRAADHNRLLQIEQQLGRAGVWLGRAAYKGERNQAAARA